MKVAVIGSRGLKVNDLEKYLPKDVTEIVSGGARGIDTCAREYAVANGLKLTEFLPEYEKYGRVAPLRRNLQIIDYSDEVLAFWDGKSRGTKYVIEQCHRKNKKVTVMMPSRKTAVCVSLTKEKKTAAPPKLFDLTCGQLANTYNKAKKQQK